MNRVVSFALVLLAAAPLYGGEGDVIDAMDTLRFHQPKEKATAELVEGKVGKAVRFHFDKGAQSVFFTKTLHGTPAWDKAAGFSFWVKGDGTAQVGGLQLIYADDYAVRYDFAFPIKGTDWQKVIVHWGDLIPVLPGPKAKPLDPKTGNHPSKLTALWFGKWWYWRDYPAQTYTIDEIRLETKGTWYTTASAPKGEPLKRTLTKLQKGEPITIVTMGDSLTDTRHWANRKVAWPALLKEQLQAKYTSKVTIVNPAIGGTQLLQNVVLIPTWLDKDHAPDLVTFCFGGNDWESGMRGEAFEAANKRAIGGIQYATLGRADVLVMTAVPSVEQWLTRTDLAEAGRKAAKARDAGLADTEQAFLKAGAAAKERLYVHDRVHLSEAGHALMAQSVLQAIEKAGR